MQPIRSEHPADPITPEELEELLAIVRAPPPEPVLSEAGRWRKEYREAQARKRIAGNTAATFGPPRADRPAYLSPEEREEIIRGAANWLRLGQRVRIVDGPAPVDPAYGGYRWIGREGVVYGLCSPVFAERVYVFLDPVGSERAEKVAFVEIRDLEPIQQ